MSVPSSTPAQEQAQKVARAAVRSQIRPSTGVAEWISRHWMLVFSVLYGLFVGLPFLAPVFMQIGWETPARVIYFIYSFLCHQLPQRSFFLFGPQRMYDLPTIQAAWKDTIHPLVLRQFVGNPEMGWKVAWSDRMVSMYTSVLLLAWVWYPLRKRIKALPLWGFVLFLLPMAIDGSTHFISDLAGLGQGFRYTNEWLAQLTNNAFPTSFYVGNALGSFNSWMRLITGVLFGIGVVWFGFPILHETAQQTRRLAELKYRRAGLR